MSETRLHWQTSNEGMCCPAHHSFWGPQKRETLARGERGRVGNQMGKTPRGAQQVSASLQRFSFICEFQGWLWHPDFGTPVETWYMWDPALSSPPFSSPTISLSQLFTWSWDQLHRMAPAQWDELSHRALVGLRRIGEGDWDDQLNDVLLSEMWDRVQSNSYYGLTASPEHLSDCPATLYPEKVNNNTYFPTFTISYPIRICLLCQRQEECLSFTT